MSLKREKMDKLIKRSLERWRLEKYYSWGLYNYVTCNVSRVVSRVASSVASSVLLCSHFMWRMVQLQLYDYNMCICDYNMYIQRVLYGPSTLFSCIMYNEKHGGPWKGFKRVYANVHIRALGTQTWPIGIIMAGIMTICLIISCKLLVHILQGSRLFCCNS